MIIDFHTHTFPEKIADKTIDYLAQKANIPYYRRGTVDALRESMKKAGVDYSVTLPVVTAVRQTESVNRTAVENNGVDGIIAFGGIHPDCENPGGILDGLKNAGIKGIKLHPDYQGVYIDDERMIRILYEASVRDMLTVIHAGKDYGYPEETHCTPGRAVNMLNALGSVADDRIVLAHMGGVDYPDEVLEKICGRKVYLDTSFVLDIYPEKCKEIIRKHGADGILFATDSPWADQKKFIDIIASLGLTAEETGAIYSGNACRLLNLMPAE